MPLILRVTDGDDPLTLNTRKKLLKFFYRNEMENIFNFEIQHFVMLYTNNTVVFRIRGYF